MEITCRNENGITLVTLAGRLDSATSSPALTQLGSYIEHSKPQLILDAAPLEYVSSAGLRTLLGVAKKVRAAGGKIVIAAMKEHVREIFEISGFHSIIPAYQNEAAARDALAREELRRE